MGSNHSNKVRGSALIMCPNQTCSKHEATMNVSSLLATKIFKADKHKINFTT